MAIGIGQACQVKTGLFSSCGAESVAMCQYCGRFFCSRHGVVMEDGQEVCSRKYCVAKREDLVRHLAYKAIADVRNEEQRCGVDGCSYAIVGQCTRCKALYCGLHVDKREELLLHNKVRIRRMATLCAHCAERREIWTRI